MRFVLRNAVGHEDDLNRSSELHEVFRDLTTIYVNRDVPFASACSLYLEECDIDPRCHNSGLNSRSLLH